MESVPRIFLIKIIKFEGLFGQSENKYILILLKVANQAY